MISARQSVSNESVAAFGGLINYLSAITKYPMGEYLSEVDKHPVLTEEEEHALAEQVYDSNDDAAIEKLVLSNLRRVAKIALECCDDSECGLDLMDEGQVYDSIAALYQWSKGPAPVKALTYRRALPAASGR